MRMPTSTLSLRCTALAIFLASVGLLLAHQESQDATDPLARARALVEKKEHEKAAAVLRAALEQAAPNPPPPAEWTAELERIDTTHRSTADARRTGAAALLDLAAADRAEGWERMATEMEALALALDPPEVRAKLDALVVRPQSVDVRDDLQRYFAEPDTLPIQASWQLADGVLQLESTSDALVVCLGERTPPRFVLRAELRHGGKQARFGLNADFHSWSDHLRAEIEFNGVSCRARFVSYCSDKDPVEVFGSETKLDPSTPPWIPVEFILDGENATFRVGSDGQAVTLKVPPRLGAGRLGFFVELGAAKSSTCLRALHILELKEGR